MKEGTVRLIVGNRLDSLDSSDPNSNPISQILPRSPSSLPAGERPPPKYPSPMPRPLLIIDGDNLAHRAYHSTPKTVRGAEDMPINAFVGFFGMLGRFWTEEKPRSIFVAWDTLGVDTYRSKLWPPYQGGRIFEHEIVQQLDVFPTLCEAFGFGVGKAAGFEADDLMASAARAEVERGGTCLLLTTDRDSYQLVSEHVTVLSPRRGTRELERIGPVQVVERFGVLPEQVPDFKALSGD